MTEKNISIGEGSYLFNENTGVNTDPINVYYYRPKHWNTGDPIVIVFHGMNRNAELYLKYWENYSDDNNLLIVCPEFTNDKYPSSQYYNTGNVMSGSKLNSEKEWVFPVTNRIIEDVKNRTSSKSSNIFIFGHSAGAQFVHRYSILEDTNADLVIAANAGYYTMLDDGINYSYGIKGLNLTNDNLAEDFSKPLVLMLGETDTVRSDDLNQSASADKQGLTRFERGKNFYNQSKEKADELGVPFRWSLSTVPNVGHSANGMAKAAVDKYIANYNETQSEISLPSGITYNKNKNLLNVTNNFYGSSIKAADFTYTLKTIDASTDKNFINIKANYRDNIIKAGSGGSKIYGLGGNDTIYGGAGNDIFYYYSGDGNDVIKNYDSNDKLQIAGNYTKSTVENDIVFKIASGSITLENAKGKTININDDIKDHSSNTITIPSDAFIYNGHSYYIYSEICNTWEEAESYCESLGGHLAVINNSAENTILFNYMKNLGYDSAYFGFSDSEVEGKWKWINGEKSTYTNWAKNEPNGESSKEDYAMFYYKYKDGKWNDGDFKRGTVNSIRNDTNSFICEWDTIDSKIDTTNIILTNSDKSPYIAASSIKNIDASTRTKSIKITGNTSANSIIGGIKADTLIGGKGNDTLTGGADKDVFVYNSGDGNDVITDYSASQGDLIKIGTSSVTTQKSGSDSLILKVGSEKITVNGGQSQKVSVVGSNNKTTVIGGKTPLPTTITLTNSDKSPYTANSTIKNIDASKRTQSIKITGNALDNSIKGGNKADTLIGGKGDDTLFGGKGNDVFIYSNGNGNDVISDYEANDKISLSSSSSYSTTTSNKDVIINIGSGSIKLKNAKGKKLNITGGKKNSSKNSDISTGKYILNSTKNKTINGTSDNDTIENEAGNVKIFTENGNDYINNNIYIGYTVKSNFGYVTIDGGSGNDTINNYDQNVSISGGTGDDYIYNGYSYINDYIYSNHVTINGGTGNDTISKNSSAKYNIFQYSSGDGNDVITGYNSSDSISLSSSSSYSTNTSGQDVVIKVDSGSIKLKSAKGKKLNIIGGKNGKSTIDGGTTIPNDFTTLNINDEHHIDNYKNKIVINGSNISDSIHNDGSNVLINGNGGNDDIVSYDTGKYVTMIGGTGNDTIYSHSNHSFIDGGIGNDSLYANNSNITINGGKGNDSIEFYGDNNVIQYTSGDGNDTIYNFGHSDFNINISDSTYSTIANDYSDIIIKVGNNQMILKNPYSNKVNITTNSKNFIEEHWFTEDNNFIDSDLNSIVDNESHFISMDCNLLAIKSPNELDYNKDFMTTFNYSKNLKK